MSKGEKREGDQLQFPDPSEMVGHRRPSPRRILLVDGFQDRVVLGGVRLVIRGTRRIGRSVLGDNESETSDKHLRLATSQIIQLADRDE